MMAHGSSSTWEGAAEPHDDGELVERLRGHDPWSVDPVTLAVAQQRPFVLPSSTLRTSQVCLDDGTEILVRRCGPAEGSRRTSSERALDSEIRSLVRAARRCAPAGDLVGYPPGLACPVAFDVDGAGPFLAVRPYRGSPATDVAPRLIGGQQRRFAVSLITAVAQLAALDLVHGALGLDVLYVDAAEGITDPVVQIVTFERTVATGEARPFGTGRAHPGDDMLAAAQLLAVAFADASPGAIGVADLGGVDWLASSFHGAFATQPADRPSAAQVLRLLSGRPDVSPIRTADTGLDPGRIRFDQLRGRSVPSTAEPAPQRLTRAAPAPRTQPKQRVVPTRRPSGRSATPMIVAGLLVLLAVALVVVAIWASS